MIENLIKLYRHYGGISSLLRSYYFWVSLALSIISYKSVLSYSWASVALGSMPSLTGFTIASFAIVFAILSPEMLQKLIKLDKEGSSPLLSVASSIGHAVFIQVTSIMLALIFTIADSSEAEGLLSRILRSEGYSDRVFISSSRYLKVGFSSLGLFATYYGIILVLASVLSIFRMQLIVASIKRPATPKEQ